MKITYKGDYAIKAILDLSLAQGLPQKIESIAKRQDIPLKFLEQILLSLKKGGFVKSKRGRQGGYLLAKDPSKITLGDIIRHTEGPIEPISCIQKKGGTDCDFSAECVFRDIFVDISDYIANKIDSVNFAELKKRYQKRLLKGNKYLDFSI